MSGCTIYGSPWRTRLLEDVRERLFTPRSARPSGGRFGLEIELIPLDAETGAPVPIFGDPAATGSGCRTGTLQVLRELGEASGWGVQEGPHGVPALHLPAGASIAYEPGGQIEYATSPRATVAEIASDLGRVLPALIEAAAGRGIRLVGRGIDPVNGLDRARRLLPGERYVSMHRYLSAIGDAGPRMMLQTAAIQVNVELTDPEGRDADLRWRVLNAAAPYLTAMFANSSVYAGTDSGYASYRARQWRLLDRRRTGVLGRERDSAAEYTDFGLEAGWIFRPQDREPEPFVEWLIRGEATVDDWRKHLTTLFPEVRPRGWLEVRCIDALPPEWAIVPLAVTAGLLSDPKTLRRAADIAAKPDSMLLQTAAREGLSDPGLASGARELFEVALESGEGWAAADDPVLETARSYFELYTSRGRAPGAEAVEAAA